MTQSQIKEVLFQAPNGQRFRVSANRIVFPVGVKQDAVKAVDVPIRERVMLPIMSKRTPMIMVERIE